MIKTRLKVSGRVQGVFYRQSTCKKAHSLGLAGWVRNLDDGSVEIEAIGTQHHVDQLIHWCRSGPPDAVVTAVNVESWEELPNSNQPDQPFQVY